jgi:hypothetical protein
VDELDFIFAISRRAKRIAVLLVVAGLWLAPKPTNAAILAYWKHESASITSRFEKLLPKALVNPHEPPAPLRQRSPHR